MLKFPRLALHFTAWTLLLAFLSSGLAFANPEVESDAIKRAYLIFEFENDVEALIKSRKIDHVEMQFDLKERFENYKSGQSCMYFHSDGKPCGIFFRAISRKAGEGEANIAAEATRNSSRPIDGLTYRDWVISRKELAKDMGELWQRKFGIGWARGGSAVLGGVATFATGWFVLHKLVHPKSEWLKALVGKTPWKYAAAGSKIWLDLHANSIKNRQVLGLIMTFGLDMLPVSAAGYGTMDRLDKIQFSDEEKQRANLDNLLMTAFNRATTGNDFGAENQEGPMAKFDDAIAKQLLAKEQAEEEGKKNGKPESGKSAAPEMPREIQEAIKQVQGALPPVVSAPPQILTVGQIIDKPDVEAMPYMREALGMFFTKYRMKHRDIYYKSH